MATINDFIHQATSTLGVDEATVRNATGGLLGFLQGQVGSASARDLFSELPGAADLAGRSPGPETVRSSSVLGKVTRAAGSALGGKTGAALGLAGTLKGAGLPFGQVPEMLSTFVGFVRKNVSEDVVDRILEKAPELRKYAE